jgi:3-hydroxybutyryl-CoA dehydrogenase
MHFFNPVPVMALVEVVAGQRTDPAVVEETLALARRLGKTPVLAKDTPGFIVNRIARHFSLEALRILAEGRISHDRIDGVVKGAGRFRMGPFELMDLIGIDVNFAVSRSVYEAFFHDPRFRPHPIQQRMVESGLLGRKTGRGFYEYPDSAKE